MSVFSSRSSDPARQRSAPDAVGRGVLGLTGEGDPTLFVLAGTSLGTTPVGTEGTPQWYDLRRLVNLDAVGDPVGARTPVEASFDGGPVLQALWPEPFCDQVVARLRELLDSGQMIPQDGGGDDSAATVPPVAERSQDTGPIDASAGAVSETAQPSLPGTPSMSPDPAAVAQDELASNQSMPVQADPTQGYPLQGEPVQPAPPVAPAAFTEVPAPQPVETPPAEASAPAGFVEAPESLPAAAPQPGTAPPGTPPPPVSATEAASPPLPPQQADPQAGYPQAGYPPAGVAAATAEAGLWAATDDRPLPGDGEPLHGAGQPSGELTLENVVYHGGYPGHTKRRKKCVAVMNATGLTVNGPHGPDFHIGWDVVRTVEAQNADEAKFRIGVKAHRRSTVVVFDCDQGVTIVLEANDVPTMPLKAALNEMLGGGSVKVA